MTCASRGCSPPGVDRVSGTAGRLRYGGAGTPTSSVKLLTKWAWAA